METELGTVADSTVLMLRRLRWEDCCRFKASLECAVSSQTAELNVETLFHHHQQQ